MTARLPGRLAELRRTFDQSFAEPPPPEAAEVEDLLAIRVAGDPYAVRLSEISALFTDHTATPLPCALPELLGIAGFRGAIIPVYDLAKLLGYPGAVAPRWLVIIAGAPPVALAFGALDGHLRLAAGAITGAGLESVHGPRALCSPDGMRSVVDVPALRAAISARAQQADPTRKR